MAHRHEVLNTLRPRHIGPTHSSSSPALILASNSVSPRCCASASLTIRRSSCNATHSRSAWAGPTGTTSTAPAERTSMRAECLRLSRSTTRIVKSPTCARSSVACISSNTEKLHIATRVTTLGCRQAGHSSYVLEEDLHDIQRQRLVLFVVLLEDACECTKHRLCRKTTAKR